MLTVVKFDAITEDMKKENEEILKIIDGKKFFAITIDHNDDISLHFPDYLKPGEIVLGCELAKKCVLDAHMLHDDYLQT